ncbi:MAG TPA: RNA pseudouridine synthase [Bacteroidales bacterium]|nr:RNA pseudouridine synthase [Bacteroidales bacterium]HPT02639.1 RNA pseudouridine synthase [Bacteroidales bacterium]
MNANSTDSPDSFTLISNSILYEDNHLLIVNKMPSQIVQGDKTGDTPLSETLKGYIKEKYNKPGEVFLGVVHRLDRPVSGAVIFARTSKALTRLNLMLKNHEIHKTYWAVTGNKPPAGEGLLIHHLVRNEAQNKSYVVAGPRKGSQVAELHYRLIASSERYFLLEIELHTGRHHQIRAQLSAIGCPIKGDLKYGSPRSNPDGSIHLHSRKIDFIHPVSKLNISVTAPPHPEKVWNIMVNAYNSGLPKQ